MCFCGLVFAAVAAIGFMDPFVGTSGDGHVTPAAAVPFGMVQAGPDTGIGKWEYTSGYQYGDKTIIGFSQTHLNGTGRPDRTAEIVREICDRYYKPSPDGLYGNDDCGQMGAWYVFACLGFYPVNPCGGEYVIGAPQLEKITIRCTPTPNTYTFFTVLAKNLSKENKYVKSVTLNGRPLARPILRHAEILEGGTLVFEMADRQHFPLNTKTKRSEK